MAAMLAAPVTNAPPLPRRWTVEEFERIPDGVFREDERVELIDGQIYTKMPQGLAHLTALRYVFWALVAAYGPEFNVSMQIPIALVGDTRPEPDVSVLRGNPGDYDMRYPDPATEVALVVEISESSLAIDLGPKLRMYATSRVPEYWILDLTSRALQVCRAPRGEVYADMAVYGEGERVLANGHEIEIVALLPRAA